MKHSTLHRAIASLVFLISAIQFFLTVQPSVSFWDPAELSAAAYALQVPHPPGGPLFSLVGHFLYMLPIPGNIGLRMNIVSVLASACSVLFLYLTAVRLIRLMKGREPLTAVDALGTCVSAAIGALALSFCDTFWFNGTEANYFAASTFLFSAITWLMVLWYEKEAGTASWRHLLLIAFLVGLSAGVHLMSVLSVFVVVMVVVMKRVVADDDHLKKTAYLALGHAALLLVVALAMWAGQTSAQPPAPDELKSYDTNFLIVMALVSCAYCGLFWKKIFTRNSFYVPLAAASVGLAIVYPGVIKKLPSLLLLVAGDSSTAGVLVLAAILALLGFLTYRFAVRKRVVPALASLALMLVILGVTTYTMTIIRANQHPPMNENNPNSFSRLVTYLNREQYGEFPIFKRRWSGEPQHQSTWANYSSDLDFFWRYQMNHMFNRYVFWNYIGRMSFVQDAGIDWKQLYGIPFLVGLFGLYSHFRKDWKLASVFLILFLFMGYLTAFYQNQQEWQPRDRDYFYAGAYFVFAVWIALGIRGLLDALEGRLSRRAGSPARATAAGYAAVLLIGALLIPGRMLETNYRTHDRSKKWLPWDYSYNLLQSCMPDAILFTNGDNDTFPLWYLQDVEGVRRDVRIVNLSLVNTEWYIKQLKHEEPYGTPKVKISFSDNAIDRLDVTRWNPQTITLPVPSDTLKAYGVTDSAVVRSGAISFTMPAAIHYGDVGAIRVQDIMVREIVLRNTWQRPVYFANTCGEDTKIGLGDYLQVEGFAARLIPRRKPAGSVNQYYVNEALLRNNLFGGDTGFSRTYRPGFKFRGMNDPGIFYDENDERMIQSGRDTYLMLAAHYLNEAGNKAMCRATLDRMEQTFPRSIVPMEIRRQYFIAFLYEGVGDTASYRAIAGDIERAALAKINENPSDVRENEDTYQILKDIYDRTGQYGKAAELLERLLPAYPNDDQLKKEIDRYRALAAQQNKGEKKP